MFRIMLKSKIHKAIVTEASLDYEGSITIDSELLDAANILEHEKVQVVDLSNGARLETYVISDRKGSGVICVNGAAARKVFAGDEIIILSYAMVEDKKAAEMKPRLLYVDEKNRLLRVEEYKKSYDVC